MKITSYLMFEGQAEEAAGFYADLLGGKVENLYRYSQWPPSPDAPKVPEEYKEKIMHCCVVFPGGAMSVADTLPGHSRSLGDGGHVLTLSCDSIEQAEQVYARLAKWARKIPCEMGEVFYAKRYGEVMDKYGVLWAILFEG